MMSNFNLKSNSDLTSSLVGRLPQHFEQQQKACNYATVQLALGPQRLRAARRAAIDVGDDGGLSWGASKLKYTSLELEALSNVTVQLAPAPQRLRAARQPAVEVG